MSDLSHSSVSLSTQIKKVIGGRILVCFLLIMSVAFALTVYDIVSGVNQLQKNLNSQCKALESFAISQVLINNQDAIQLKLDSVSQKNGFKDFLWENKNASATKEALHWQFPFSWLYSYPVKGTDGSRFGGFVVKGSFLDNHALLSELLTKLGLLLFFLIVIFIVLYPLNKKIPQRLFADPINNLLALLRNHDAEFANIPATSIEIKEIQEKVVSLLREVEERSHEAALGQIATQVAHDIRSPLLVLNEETKDLIAIPEKKRVAIRAAIQRVNDIANNLLSQYKQERQGQTVALSSEPIAIMLDSIVSEKRIQVASSTTCIELEIEPSAYNLFVKVDISGFKRVLSNIINNSIEAVSDDGLVVIKLAKSAGKVVVSITDNGCGIPKDKLPLVLEEGTSFGKENGSGLGLFYAINKIYSWNGDYSLISEVNLGTRFEIILPEARHADWFANEILIPEHWEIVVLDDDEYIHNIWDKRFSQQLTDGKISGIRYFYSPKDLISYLSDKEQIGQTVFLFDYELIGERENGLTLIEKLGIANQSMLVTSRYEDFDIREICKKLGVRILPKLFATTAPIRQIFNNECILIDDDELIAKIWEDSALAANIKLTVFDNTHDFLRIANFYNKDIVIYIDSALGGGIKGEDFAKLLYDQGFRNLYLATGYPKDKFSEIDWVRDIIGKTPPF